MIIFILSVYSSYEQLDNTVYDILLTVWLQVTKLSTIILTILDYYMNNTLHRKLAKKYIYENYIADKKRKINLFLKIS